jgi:hypothetical protein
MNSGQNTAGEVRKLLGYYRRYIKNFAQIARLLFDLLQSLPDVKSNSNNVKNNLPSWKPILWEGQNQDVLVNFLIVLWVNAVWFFGVYSILHDQGREFETKLFHHLEKKTAIHRRRITSYHPQASGRAEIFNRMLLSIPRTSPSTSPEHWKSKWHMLLNKVVHVCNCTLNNSAGFSPFFLRFGRPLRFPVDLLFGISPTTVIVIYYCDYDYN